VDEWEAWNAQIKIPRAGHPTLNTLLPRNDPHPESRYEPPELTIGTNTANLKKPTKDPQGMKGILPGDLSPPAPMWLSSLPLGMKDPHNIGI